MKKGTKTRTARKKVAAPVKSAELRQFELSVKDLSTVELEHLLIKNGSDTVDGESVRRRLFGDYVVTGLKIDRLNEQFVALEAILESRR